MRRGLLVFICVVALTTLTAAQANRDPEAVTLVSRSILLMGGSPPADSIATGEATLVEGSSSEVVPARIATKGIDHFAEHIADTDDTRSFTCAGLRSREKVGSKSRVLPIERSITCHADAFPLVMLSAAMSDQDTSLTYVGLETIGSFRLHHIEIQNTFASRKNLQALSRYSAKHIWLDETTGLPARLKYERRDGRGAIAPIEVEVLYGDFRNVSGFLYPFKIIKLLNGTVWATTKVNSVSLNTGVSDAEFELQ
jgi:hypothetical protein